MDVTTFDAHEVSGTKGGLLSSPPPLPAHPSLLLIPSAECRPPSADHPLDPPPSADRPLPPYPLLPLTPLLQTPLGLCGSLLAAVADSRQLRHLTLDMDSSREAVWEKVWMQKCVLCESLKGWVSGRRQLRHLTLDMDSSREAVWEKVWTHTCVFM